MWASLCRSLALAILAFVVVCCRSSSDETARRDAAALGAFRVAIVLPGPHDDHEWSQAGYEGLQLIETELGATVAYTENVASSRFAEVASAYAAQGFAFVIGHGAEYADAAVDVASRFPRTKFALVALHPGNNRNLGAIRFREGEIGYLTGVVAGLRSRTKKVAYVAGMKFRHLEDQAAFFARGAKAIAPEILVETVWLGTWTDAEKARSAARSLIERGVDVLSINADKAGLSAIEEAKNASVWAIGWNLDQYDVAPGTVVTSGVQRIPVLLLEAARLVRQGRWEGKQYKFGLREGAQDLAPFRGQLSDDEAAIVARIREDILTGALDVSEPLQASP